MKEYRRTQPLEAYELLSTKLAVPRPHAPLVARESLFARLDAGLERKLTLLSAPAGFGKTTLVSAWLATRGERQDSPPVVWVSLDAGDNDPVRFWRYIIAACQGFDASVGASALELLQMSQRLPLESVLTTFINELAGLEQRFLLVLEDYHVISSPQIHETVTYLVDHLPASLHLLLLTRNDPPLPLARLRVHDDLYELHAADLLFSPEETRAFLQQTLPFAISSEATARLEARVEGWVTGLRLLTLALQGRKDPRDLEHMLVTFNGGHRHVLEYLVADVLTSQPEVLQEFLLQTAFLNRLTGSLCDAITGRNDGTHMLEQLEHANLFLLPLDDERQWYRYHTLFAEAMQHEARRRLGEDTLHVLYNRASLWYEQHNLLAEAVETALSAGNCERAAVLIERIIGPYNTSDELHTLLRWIEPLPEDVLQAHPKLCLAYAIALMFTLDRSAPATWVLVRRPLEMAERFLLSEGSESEPGSLLALRSLMAWWQGDLVPAFADARRSLALLSERETLWYATSTLTVGLEEMFAAKPDTALQITQEARRYFAAAGNPYGVRAATYVLGEICSLQGELYAAAQHFRRELAEATDDPFDRANALVGLAALSYEWNDLQTAEQEVSQALTIGKHHAERFGEYYTDLFLRVPASLALARVLHARGEIMPARHLLQELAALTQERRWTYLHREVLATLARLQSADLPAVQRWSVTVAQLGEDVRVVQQEREALIQVRLLIAQGEASAALSLLERWQEQAHEQGRTRSELEMKTLMALAHSANKQQAQAMLKEVLALAQVEGYQRLFLDEGEALVPLLRAVLSDVQEPLTTYVRVLLAAFARREQNSAPPSRTDFASLIEPLSQQEQRVLRLLAAGRSNPEIAAALVVSINTVKTQVQSIYRKLNVNSRWEAREAASRLKLL
jgi:LuxR family transcriptional regulator, maltose regulon positive regulatory protein